MTNFEGIVDWGVASEAFDRVRGFVAGRDLTALNEAQTRFDVIDRMIKEVLGWQHGHISVEEYEGSNGGGYVDYLLRLGDNVLVVEAKRTGAPFPNPTRKRTLKVDGSVLGEGEVRAAMTQALEYAQAKGADVIVVSNGRCWVCFTPKAFQENGNALLFFPFDSLIDAEDLYRLLSESAVESGGLTRLSQHPARSENRLLQIVRDADGRVDRNNIADHITPALDNALYADSLLSNVEALERCFITSEARSKFDSLLGMHLKDPKPLAVQPARRIRSGKQPSDLDSVVSIPPSSFAPPVTLIIGPVGAGKSTYLRHFELLAGRDTLHDAKAHWIYVDYEQLGKSGNPRAFLYARLRDYLTTERQDGSTDFKHLVEPAYSSEIAGLARGPLAPIFLDKPEFNRRVAEHIQRDFEAVEPYVDKLLKHLGSSVPCIVVLDNVDLYEDDALEIAVFAEGLGLSKRVHCHVIATLRDRTFVKHRSESTFNAYELRKLWLDPPPFKTVLSARLTYAKKILEGESAQVHLERGMHLNVPDLSVFFDIVQRSILQGEPGEYIEAMADLNIRRGLQLVTNFLTSGHIQADRALSSYIQGEKRFAFPFHEIFKGTMLGQWKHYREDRSECFNLFDSHLGSRQLRLLRLHILGHLVLAAQREESLEVAVASCIRLFSEAAASDAHVLTCLASLQAQGLIRCLGAEAVSEDSTVVATKSGGYLWKILSSRMVYVESCMLDTAIDDPHAWDTLSAQTTAIEYEGDIVRRVELRADRLVAFVNFLEGLETQSLQRSGALAHCAALPHIKRGVLEEVDRAVASARRYYGQR